MMLLPSTPGLHTSGFARSNDRSPPIIDGGVAHAWSHEARADSRGRWIESRLPGWRAAGLARRSRTHVRSCRRRERRLLQPRDVLPGSVGHEDGRQLAHARSVPARRFELAELLAARAGALALHLRPLPREGAAVLGHRLREDPRRQARHVQRPQLLEEAGRCHHQRSADRGLPHWRGLAADVVSAGRHQRRDVHRRGLHHRRQRRGGHPPRRRRDLGDLDGQHPRRMASRLRRLSISTSSRPWPTRTSSARGRASRRTTRPLRPAAPANSAGASS